MNSYLIIYHNDDNFFLFITTSAGHLLDDQQPRNYYKTLLVGWKTFKMTIEEKREKGWEWSWNGNNRSSLGHSQNIEVNPFPILWTCWSFSSSDHVCSLCWKQRDGLQLDVSYKILEDEYLQLSVKDCNYFSRIFKPRWWKICHKSALLLLDSRLNFSSLNYYSCV